MPEAPALPTAAMQKSSHGKQLCATATRPVFAMCPTKIRMSYLCLCCMCPSYPAGPTCLRLLAISWMSVIPPTSRFKTASRVLDVNPDRTEHAREASPALLKGTCMRPCEFDVCNELYLVHKWSVERTRDVHTQLDQHCDVPAHITMDQRVLSNVCYCGLGMLWQQL